MYHPWTSYVIVPLFALANAGIPISGSFLSRALTSPITLGILIAYIVGKPVGITGSSWLLTRLTRGDILTVDIGVILDGWVADAAITHPIGNVTPIAQRLLATTKAALFDAVEHCQAGGRLGDVSHAVQERVEAEGLAIVRSLVGHGVGRSMHEDPQVPNYGDRGRGPKLEEGMVLAIEPMVNAGRHMVRMGDDGWAIYSQDGSLAAHFEFTVAITADGPRILTPWHEDDGES